MKQWEKGEILISREPKTLVLYMGDGITDGTFKGRALESENFRLENSVMVNWSREAFEIATKENTPRKWWKYFPLPNWKDGDFLVGGSFTDIDGQKVKAIVIFKNYYDATDFIGERISPFKDGRHIRGSYSIYDFELATKENAPKELWAYLPTTIADVAQEITNIMRGEDDMKDELKIGDMVKIVACYERDDVVLGDLIGKVGIIDGFYGNNEIAEIYFGQLPEHAIISGLELHDCKGKYKESKYFRLGKEYLELIERKQDTECSNGKEDKYQVIKLNPTENQERQYGVMLIKNLTEIIEGKTIAFINSKGSGGVIYGRKANGLLHKLVISNPNKVITVVKTLKAHGKKQESIKQISIKIDDTTEDSQFVL